MLIVSVLSLMLNFSGGNLRVFLVSCLLPLVEFRLIHLVLYVLLSRFRATDFCLDAFYLVVLLINSA
jgi:hypothetical protein